MRETTVARTYAAALLELASREDADELYAQRLHEVVDLIESESDFRHFLDTPGVQPAEKNAVLRDVFGRILPDSLLRFLFIVIDKRRQRLLPAIADEFSALVDEQRGRVRVKVTLVQEPSAALEKTIKARLTRILEKDVIPHYRVDPRIIGGVIFREGDRVADGSVRRRLQLLRRQLLRAELG